MENKSLGVIGGMGPKATSVFFEKIIDRTLASQDQDHINMVILNHAALPDRTQVILEKKEGLFLKSIEKDMKLLEHAGVANIAIPCNTSHYFYNEMQAMTSVPIINMVDETLNEIYETYGSGTKIGLLATDGTVNSGIYEKGCEAYNMAIQLPSKSVQQQVMDIIYQVKSNVMVDVLPLEGIINDLVHVQQCRCVILACTELSCLNLTNHVMKYCVDAMEVLVKRSIALSGKKYNPR